jgi:hypothetical protein
MIIVCGKKLLGFTSQFFRAGGGRCLKKNNHFVIIFRLRLSDWRAGVCFRLEGRCLLIAARLFCSLRSQNFTAEQKAEKKAEQEAEKKMKEQREIKNASDKKCK